jgi:hypothetical protein
MTASGHSSRRFDFKQRVDKASPSRGAMRPSFT